jgi:uncharacterized protein (DUF697 family)
MSAEVVIESEKDGPVVTDREQEARHIIRNYVYGNAAVGLIPLPMLDLVALTGVQLKMVHSLAQLYGVEFKSDAVKSILLSLAGSLGALTVGTGLFMSAMKVVPALGMTLGFLAFPACTAAFTYAVGRAFVMHFEAGGNILNFDAKAMHVYFKKFYQEGLTEARAAEVAHAKAKKADGATVVEVKK